MKLNKSHVLFDAETHTYTLDGASLHGITGMIEKQLFPDKYKGIPEAVMSKAAERGTMVHETCELVDDIGIQSDMPEANNYKRMVSEYGLQYEASEYLVSDEHYFASCIDKVYRVDDITFILADIKTTSKLDTEYVSWQLSIYATLFEAQNKGTKVSRLYAIWLRGEESKMVEVNRIPDEEVLKLLSAEIDGVQYTNPYAALTTLPKEYLAMESAIVEIQEQYKYWEGKKKELTERVMREMVKAGQQKWVGNRISFTMRTPSVRKSFDKERFKAEHPDLYEQYISETPQTSSITLKIK